MGNIQDYNGVRDYNNKTHVFSGTIIRETEKAYLIAVDGFTDEQWFPKSVLSNEDIRNEDITCEVPEWIAKERKLL